MPDETPEVVTKVSAVAEISPPVPWYKSQRFIALAQSTVLWVLGWLIAALSTNEWAWRAMAIGVLSNTLIALKDWWSPAVKAPAFAAAFGANKSQEVRAFVKVEKSVEKTP